MQPTDRGERRALPAGFSALWVTVALDLVGFGIVIPVLARYAERFDASPTTAGLIVASFSVAQLVFAPIWGAVSDRIGRKPVLIVSLVGTAVGSLLTGLAGSVGLLFLGRIIDGASGASVSVAQATVTDVAEPEDRPRLLGYLGAAFGIGFVAGPVLGGLAALISPAAPFLVAAAIAGTNAVVAAVRLPDSPRAASAPADEVHTVGAGLRRLLLVAFVSMVAFSAFEATFSLLVGSPEGRFDMTLSQVYATFGVIGVALAFVQTRLVQPAVDRFGVAGSLRLALLCNAAGFALLAAAVEPVVLIAAVGALVVGQGIVTPTLSSAVAGQADPARRGRSLGAQQSAGGLARVVGPAAGGALFGHVGVASPYVVGAVLAVGAAALLGEGRSLAPDDR